MGRVLQTCPRSQALPPPRWLDCATDPVASVQALEKRRLATAVLDDALPRARACQLNRVKFRYQLLGLQRYPPFGSLPHLFHETTDRFLLGIRIQRSLSDLTTNLA